jgi:pimeloyl-[acyl-carrier protein] methyl ester esterase
VDSIVFLHGWGTAPGVFDELSARLTERYEVHTPALCGYGDEPLITPYTIEGLAEAAAAAAPARCHVAGWSLGGQIALVWARALPHQVASLILFGTTPSFVRRVDWDSAIEPHVLHDFAIALERDSASALTRFVSLQTQNDTRAKSVAHSLRERLRRGPAPSREALTEGLRLLSQTDLRGELSHIANDTLIVQGDRDGLVPLGFLWCTVRRMRLSCPTPIA